MQPRSETKGTNKRLRIVFRSLRGIIFSKVNCIGPRNRLVWPANGKSGAFGSVDKKICSASTNAAVMVHHPCAYIGGLISLPVARSEFVDVDFWRAELINGQPMGTALNTAAAAHGLTGALLPGRLQRPIRGRGNVKAHRGLQFH
jgi:hypothetical protein